MIIHLDYEADMLIVLSRLSSRYLNDQRAASRSTEQLELCANGKILSSAIGSSCE